MKIIFALIFLVLVSISGTSQTLPNKDFEDWESNILPPYEDPKFWNTPNVYTAALGAPSVKKSDDAFSGEYSALIETVEILDGLFKVPGLITYGTLNINIPDTSYSFYGGISMKEKVRSLSGQYKYQGVEDDSAMVLIYTYSHPEGEDLDTIGLGYTFLHDAETWTPFTVEMNYLNDHSPDTFNVLIVSSGTIALDEIQSGSVLQVDDLTIETGLGISDKYQTLDLNVYPNPVSDLIKFETNETDRTRKLAIYDMTGRKLREVRFEEKQIDVNVSDLLSGNYIYKISNKESLLNSGTFIKQ